MNDKNNIRITIYQYDINKSDSSGRPCTIQIISKDFNLLFSENGQSQHESFLIVLYNENGPKRCIPKAATAASNPSFSSLGDREDVCTERLGGRLLGPFTGQAETKKI